MSAQKKIISPACDCPPTALPPAGSAGKMWSCLGFPTATPRTECHPPMSIRMRFAALAALLVVPSFLFAQLPPDKALASLSAVDGMQVELFAAEPLLVNPTSIDVDHLG